MKVRKLLLNVIVFIFSGLAAGCVPLTHFTPEQAVVQELRDRIASGNLVQGSVKILQKVEFEDNVYVMIAFQDLQTDGRRMSCVHFYQTVKHTTGWRTGSGGGGCSSAPADGKPFDIIAGQSHIKNADAVSYVYGEVDSEQIAELEVTWEDGQTQRVPVVNRSFAAIQKGTLAYEQITGLDKDGKVIHTEGKPKIAPGKIPELQHAP